jgi:hypothetical protein
VILLIMNKFDVSLLAGALIATGADARLWAGLPHSFTPNNLDKSWWKANKTTFASGGTPDWVGFFNDIAGDATCQGMLEHFNKKMDLGGFMALSDAKEAYTDQNGDGFLDITEYINKSGC